jgi:hypothetical protein
MDQRAQADKWATLDQRARWATPVQLDQWVTLDLLVQWVIPVSPDKWDQPVLLDPMVLLVLLAQ